MELFKCMDNENLEWVRKILDKWWNDEEETEELTKALVVSLYKKGDPKKQ